MGQLEAYGMSSVGQRTACMSWAEGPVAVLCIYDLMGLVGLPARTRNPARSMLSKPQLGIRVNQLPALSKNNSSFGNDQEKRLKNTSTCQKVKGLSHCSVLKKNINNCYLALFEISIRSV